MATGLALCALAEVARRPVGLLSGGYQRRVNIAASLMARPRLVLLDEPTQGVDLHARAAIHAVLGRLREAGTALLVATHDFAEAERLADRVAILARGRIITDGRLSELLARIRADAPEHEAALVAPADGAAEAVLRRAGFVPVDTGSTWRARHLSGTPRDGADLLAALRHAGVPIAEIRIRAPGLEAVYRDAVAGSATPAEDGVGTGDHRMISAAFRVMLLGLVRDRAALVMAFVLPTVIFVIFAAIFSGALGDRIRIHVGLLDLARTPTTQRLMQALEADPSLRVGAPRRHRSRRRRRGGAPRRGRRRPGAARRPRRRLRPAPTSPSS